MKILIVTTRFFPYGSATSGVVGNLAEALCSNGCEVHVLALTRYKEDALEEKWNEVYVKKVYAPEIITIEQFKKERKADTLQCFKGILIKSINRLIRRVPSFYGYYSLDYSTLKKYKNSINTELKREYDLCIATLMPIEAVVACNSISNMYKNTIFGIYQLDPYWNNDDLPKEYKDKRLKLEIELVKKSDFCMTTPILHMINIKIDAELDSKYISAEFPCLKPVARIKEKTEGDNLVHCVFLGTLYPDLRPPEKLIEIIANIKNTEMTFDFYGSGQNLIQQAPYYEKAKRQISILGQVSSAEAESIRENADVLVNIDNTSTTLVPSKIFEYVSTGLPIINCYFFKESQALKYLESYPKCLNINMYDSASDNAKRISKFIAELDDSRLEFSEVEKIYIKNTPQYVANQCINVMQHKKRGLKIVHGGNNK